MASFSTRTVGKTRWKEFPGARFGSGSLSGESLGAGTKFTVGKVLIFLLMVQGLNDGKERDRTLGRSQLLHKSSSSSHRYAVG